MNETHRAPDQGRLRTGPRRADISSTASCVFCAIAAEQAPATVVRRWDTVIAIRPRHPVTSGHVLEIGRAHV